MAILDYIVSLGASVMMPIIITLFGLLLGAKFSKAIRSGLTVGIGFIGLNLVIGLLMNNLGPASQKMVERLGLSLTVIDVGWPAAAAISFASVVGAIMIPIGLGINILMLITKQTRTVNIDIWNFWHFAFTGALVAAATNSIAWGVFASAINMVIVMYLADWTAPGVEEYNGLPGVSLPHGFSAAYVPIALVINKLIDMIPGIKNIKADPETLQKRFGIFGEPMIIGSILGLAIGAFAGYDFKAILNLGVTMGAVLILIPKMAAMLMEGLLPISDAAQEFIEKRFKNAGKVYIGLDSAVAIGHPACMSASLVLVPVTILLAAVIPGNKVLPFADLAVLPFMLCMVIPVTKGNVFRTFIIGFLMVASGLLIATNMAPLHTQLAINANFQMPEGATQIASICDGANPLTWVLLQISKFKMIGAAILCAIVVGMAFLNQKIRKAQDVKAEN
ncbi:PTS galactitol transporter subunit IIC [Geosporobacter ferrireducens]|uniref:PTS galactitol transporter subunit IIC n=1 Tax=Geosporobacter ferrireducens TaxID=1424294 RepID=UPI00139EF008|nr:PTS transporter subunit IIC [Geosporobacter ferrireducens]MTI55045.1 PTS galactitol transporter subunit IIC [Geosporobacter ferrireducens]